MFNYYIMKSIIEMKRLDGSTKSKKEIDHEKDVLLNTYRRQNLLLNDRIVDITENVVTQKEIAINDLKEENAKLLRDIKYWKDKYKNRGWFT